jgi:hypothetical protein
MSGARRMRGPRRSLFAHECDECVSGGRAIDRAFADMAAGARRIDDPYATLMRIGANRYRSLTELRHSLSSRRSGWGAKASAQANHFG